MIDTNKQPIKKLEEDEEDNGVSLTWTWYLLLGACFLLLLGIALSWILITRNVISSQIYYLPSLICSLISICLLISFVYFDTKDFNLLKFHVPKKVFNIYFASIFIFALSILFAIIYLFFYRLSQNISTDVFFIIGFIISAVLTLIAIGLYRYAKYKIDLTIYLRKHGKDTKTDETKSKPSNSSSQASSGLTDAIKK